MAAKGKVVLVDKKLHHRLKILAAKEGTTVQALTEEAVRMLLETRKER